MRDYRQGPPPSRWPVVLPVALLAVLTLGWSVFWYFAAGRAEAEIAAWRAREATNGRMHSCGEQALGGYPFRIEWRCADPSAIFRKERVSLAAKASAFAIQIYQPSLMIGEFTGPLTIAENGQPPNLAVDWSLAQISLRGLSRAPERVSVVLDAPSLARPGTPTGLLAKAARLELHARQAPRLPQDTPAVEVALSLAQATLPGLVPGNAAARQPVDADIVASLRGVRDLTPKPIPQHLRDLQAANGKLDITSARVRQGEILAVGQGTLTLTPAGRLDGQIRLTVVGLDQLVVALGIDKAVGQASQNTLDRLAPGLNLDRLLGGRGNVAIAAAGVAMLGQPAELEGKRAVALPLRFADGVVFLGPLRVGEVPPVF